MATSVALVRIQLLDARKDDYHLFYLKKNVFYLFLKGLDGDPGSPGVQGESGRKVFIISKHLNGCFGIGKAINANYSINMIISKLTQII